jgi:polyphosphate kinase 2 (PPK2 family)
MAQPLCLPPGRDIRLADFDADFHEGLGKEAGKAETRRLWEELDDLAYRLYAEARRAVVVVLQGIDAAGKDGTIRMLARGISPQCLDVVSFKTPSQLELAHDFLWRVHKAMPGHGRIGIFNRTYYEEVLIVRVHEALLAGQKLPPRLVTSKIWTNRFEDICSFERYLARNGTLILKFFLNFSKDEQKKRVL